MKKQNYHLKLENILNDSSKFMKITCNPTDSFKELSVTIIAISAANKEVQSQKLSVEYSPGYIYGNIKTHWSGNPFLPIISQIPTPTYALTTSLKS